jgi:antitoxin PrlF
VSATFSSPSYSPHEGQNHLDHERLACSTQTCGDVDRAPNEARRLAAHLPMPYNDPESKESPLAESAVTSKGQITIPADVRRAMGLQHQDRVVFTVMPDGTTVMRAKTRSLHTLAGVLKGRGKKLSVKKMRIGR